MQNNLSKKALGMSAAALLTILLPRLIRRRPLRETLHRSAPLR